MSAEMKKRCLYEVLGVSRDCSVDEIRSAYRKLALQLHPDKVAAASGGIVSEAATAAFQELLHAYEVLSDPRERAYYDSHRSQILFSETDVGPGRNNSCFDLDLFSCMSPSAFSGYSDTGRGFYKVYCDAFDKIYSQELRFAKAMGLASDTVHPAPLMGNLESPYTQVSAFYNYWLSFCTALDFAWVDMYDAAAGYDRRERRKMEEENKKLRRKAKREYNETVRGLAAFVKKRDKRVMDMAVKKKAEEEKKKAEEREKKKEEEKRKLEKAMRYEEPDWSKADSVDEEDAMKDDDDYGLEGEDNRRKELYCVVCSKKFKSEKQWKNHEQSKKHKDKVAEFRSSIVDEEEEDDQEHQELSEHNVHDMEDSDPHASLGSAPEVKSDDELCDQFEGLLDAGEETDEAVASDAESDNDAEAKILEAMISGHKGKKGSSFDQYAPAPAHAPVSDLNGNVDSEEKSHTQYNIYKKGGKSRARRKGGKGKMDEDGQKQMPIDVVNSESASHSNNETLPEMESSHSVQADKRNNEHNHVSGKNQKTKQQKFDGKIIATEGYESTPKKPSKGKKQKGGSKAPSNGCDTCGENFDSRNKLFMHLGETGHSTLKSR